MSCTPITPDDWTDTVETKCAEAFVECLSSDIGYNLRHYARIAHASHRMGEGCRCRPSRIPHVVPIASESARGGCMADFDAPQAPQEVPTPERPANPGPALPRPIEPADVRVGMVVERRKGEAAMRDRVHLIDNALIGPTGFCLWMPEYAAVGWSLWMIEDAPAPVDPDAEVIERVAQVLHKQGCSWCDTGEDLEAHYGSAREAWREDARAVLAVVREHTVTARAEQ